MHIFSDFNEFKAAVGTELGVSEWIDVTEERINLFAQATCDDQWIHVDQVPAKTGTSRWRHRCQRTPVAEPGADVHSLRDRSERSAQHVKLWGGPDPLSLPRPGRLAYQRPNQHRGGRGHPA